MGISRNSIDLTAACARIQDSRSRQRNESDIISQRGIAMDGMSVKINGFPSNFPSSAGGERRGGERRSVLICSALSTHVTGSPQR